MTLFLVGFWRRQRIRVETSLCLTVFFFPGGGAGGGVSWLHQDGVQLFWCKEFLFCSSIKRG